MLPHKEDRRKGRGRRFSDTDIPAYLDLATGLELVREALTRWDLDQPLDARWAARARLWLARRGRQGPG